MTEPLPREVELSVSKAVADMGIEVHMAAFAGVTISNKTPTLQQYIKERVPFIKNIDLHNPILQEYNVLQSKCGIKAPKAPAQRLIELVKKNSRLPNINTVVDSYNIVSAETFLSIGAHDLDKIKGDVYFKLTRGDEHYILLGSKSAEKVNAGEYAAMDEEKIICRLDIKQCEQTRITKDTKQFIVYVQGNRSTPPKLLDDALQRVCKNITKFCGGYYITVKPEITR